MLPETVIQKQDPHVPFFCRGVVTREVPFLNFPASCISERCIEIQINLIFYFYISLGVAQNLLRHHKEV